MSENVVSVALLYKKENRGSYGLRVFSVLFGCGKDFDKYHLKADAERHMDEKNPEEIEGYTLASWSVTVSSVKEFTK